MRIHGPLLIALSFTAACAECDLRGDQVPEGGIDPAAFDFGPIDIGETCRAELFVTNDGRVDMDVGSAALEDVVGDWTLERTPSLVRLAGREALLVAYTASGAIGARQGATVVLQTDDPDADGALLSTLSALVASGPAAIAKSRCGDEGTSPCPSLAFGPVQVNGAGLTLLVAIENDGTAPLSIAGAVVDGGTGAFEARPPRLSSTGDPGAGVEVAYPVELPPRRDAPCGTPNGSADTLYLPIHYLPTALAEDEATLVVVTDGLEGASLSVPLSGVGANVGLLLDPEVVRFGAVPEGEAAAIEVRVASTGTNDMRVDEVCLDLEADGACDGRCTGAAGERLLGGSLGCAIPDALGAAGFLLEPTDGRAGGNDERIVRVDWTPVAAHPAIPATAVLALRTNILGNRVFTVPVRGGATGALAYSTASADACPAEAPEGFVCVEAAGDPEDTQTWTGEVTIALQNVGGATLTIASIAFEDGTPTIADDFTLGTPASTALPPGASTTFVVTYANNDFSGADLINVLVDHDGADAPSIIPLGVVAPP